MIRKLLVIATLSILACSNKPSLKPVEEGDNDSGFGAGYSCTSNDQCVSGVCMELFGLMQCAAACDYAEDCPADLVCARIDPRDPASFQVCIPKSNQLCNSCERDSDCGQYGHMCHGVEGEKVCLGACDAEDACPAGYYCKELSVDGAQTAQCYPTAETCSCTAVNDGEARTCYNAVAGIGSCEGFEVCDVEQGWGACDAATPELEEDYGCDGIDNDCDGLTDEAQNGQPLSKSCGYGYEGNPGLRPPECTGVQQCVAGQWSECTIQDLPLEETACDGLDEDCDGEVDEGFLGTNEHCTACNDRCEPGFESSSVHEWGCLGQDVGCDPYTCNWPFFDVDGDPSNACELVDDYVDLGDDQVAHTYTVGNARRLHHIHSGTNDGTPCAGKKDDENCGEVHLCDARLPRDFRPNYFSAQRPNVDSIEGNDYYLFWYEWNWLCAPWCDELTLKVVFDPQGDDYNTKITVCLSKPLGDSDGQPAGTPDFTGRCMSVDLNDSPPYEVNMGQGYNNWLDGSQRFYYILVKAERSGATSTYDNYGGVYHIQLYENTSQVGYIDQSDSPCN